MRLYETTVESVGPDAAELIAGGVMILFAAGAPPELAEVSVLHTTVQEPGEAPRAGDELAIGSQPFRITAVGATAWNKVRDMGHVVFSFTGADQAERPGEIILARSPGIDVASLLAPGSRITISRPQ